MIMKILNLASSISREELLAFIADSDRVNDRVRFDENKGKPRMHIKEKGSWLRISCEMVGGANRDNGFLEGTYFLGRLAEKDGATRLRGVVLTAPIYHLLIAAIMVIYVIRSISLGGFNPVPLLLLGFSILMFKNEFAKQGIIERYLKRAIKRAENETD